MSNCMELNFMPKNWNLKNLVLVEKIRSKYDSTIYKDSEIFMTFNFAVPEVYVFATKHINFIVLKP